MKKIVAVILSLAMILSLAACGNSGAAAETEASAAETEAAAAETEAAAGETEAAAPAAAGEAEYTYNISVDASEEELIYKYAVKLSELVAEKTGGRVALDVYGNAALGDDSEALQSCADGQIAFVICTTAPQVDFMPEMAMFDLPNLFNDINDFRAMFEKEDFVNFLEGIYEGAGFRLMGVADSGFRVMSSNKKVESLDDLKGIKIRTMKNNNHIAIWQAYGANPTPMSFSEVYIGLQQGTIDAQENPIEVLASAKFYEVQDYVIMTNHLPHACCLIMSDKIYNELPDDLKTAVEEACEEASAATRELSDTIAAEQLEVIKGSGTEVIELSDDVLAQMKEACSGVYENIKSQVGEDVYNTMLEAAGAQ